MPTLINKENC